MGSIISVIVPVYNPGEYLRQCLDNLIGQTLAEIEIICVNDGSTDGSLQVLRDYASRDARIIVVELEKLGVATARNEGLRRAGAPYIMFCDSDDYFDPDMCRKMHAILTKHDVDVVTCGMNIISEIPEYLMKDVLEYQRVKFSGKYPLTWEKVIDTDASLCDKIYKRSIIEQHGIRFPDGLHYEDAYFNDLYLTAAGSIYYLQEKLYNYVRVGDSIMSRSFVKSGIALDNLQVLFLLHDYLEQNDLLGKYCDFYWHRFIQYFSFAVDNLAGEQRTQARKTANAYIAGHRAELDSVAPNIQAGIKRVLSVTWPLKSQARMTYRKVRGRLA
jgi:glycosyltransferase involved in cell wall biosynthesis